jgi:hypothetical protein
MAPHGAMEEFLAVIAYSGAVEAHRKFLELLKLTPESRRPTLESWSHGGADEPHSGAMEAQP